MVETLRHTEKTEAVSSPEIKPEYELVNVGTIAIFGEEGAGKSNLSEVLAKALNARLLQGGQIVRAARLHRGHRTAGRGNPDRGDGLPG